MLDNLIESFLRIFGLAGRTIAKEKVKEHITDFALETIEEVAQEKLLPKDSNAEVKPSQNFQELIASMVQEGMGITAALSLFIAIIIVALLLLRDLIGNRFFFHAGNIIYGAEIILVFFAALFVPTALIGKAAPLFLKLKSRRTRGWIAFVLFMIFFGIVIWLISSIFPGLPEVMAKHMK